MLLKLGSERDVDVKLTARAPVVGTRKRWQAKCVDCGRKVWTTADTSGTNGFVCSACAKSPAANLDEWTCSDCGYNNDRFQATCCGCDMKSPLVCVYVKCRGCGVKVWTSEHATEVVCAACLHKLDVVEAVRS